MKRVLALSVLILLLLCGCDKKPVVESEDLETPPQVTDTPPVASRPGLAPVDDPHASSNIPFQSQPPVNVGGKELAPLEPGDNFEDYVEDIFSGLGYTEDQVSHEGTRSRVYVDYGDGTTAYLEIEQKPSNPQKVGFYYIRQAGIKQSDYGAIAEDANTLLGTNLDADYVKSVISGVYSFTYGMGDTFVYLYSDGKEFQAYMMI